MHEEALNALMCVIQASSDTVLVSHMFSEFMLSFEEFYDHNINSFMFGKYVGAGKKKKTITIDSKVGII